MRVGQNVLEPVRRPSEPGRAVNAIADDRVAERSVAHLAALAAAGPQAIVSPSLRLARSGPAIG
jgi:hypothetical protein